ncbi:MAG: hypothetical protein J6K52_07950 [Clostridia bacterium]|nr:hypothetical protein [Clostridia bacterium]
MLGIIILFITLFFHFKDGNPSNDKNYKKELKASIVISILILTTALLFSSFYIYKAINPDVQTFIGVFEYEEKASRRSLEIGMYKYMFSLGNEENKRALYLNSSAMEEIFPEGFEGQETYKIWYEYETKIILGVEKIE